MPISQRGRYVDFGLMFLGSNVAVGRVGSRRGPGFEWCRRLLDPPFHSVRRVFPSTAGGPAYQAGPSRRVNQLKPAPGMR